ncbi:Uncharacterised protein [Mycobacterium tuberculosis]|uniref:Uncharacterized protein n=1 Tax=Mycobacterium tuberculosis TaxID=1773 RepID=A0A0U0UII2_MYCTX|nr:Uncharacterised protein [Mycobacterium tuberculosis]COV99973.1 Uncharacterised protein [Mycobacterium tuberculosis]COY76648.1 Uncharacterised protein [Mycobacterium tuberculosis]COZ77545.1 Uncharacterised protein [Mycobacterium tuberculosis]COZ86188.1 Uncharacterised protein [Mycobacterium tuberculosis]
MVATRVPKFTAARTPGSLLRVDSTRWAHAEHDIPLILSCIRCTLAWCSPVTAVVIVAPHFRPTCGLRSTSAAA